MAQHHIICGIDIGNTQTKVVVAKPSQDGSRPQIIGVGTASSTSAVRNSVIVDMQEATNNLRLAIHQAEQMASVPVQRAYLAVSGDHIRSQISRGVVAVSRADQEISQSDVDRVIQAASALNLPPNRRVIHTIPREFIVDERDSVRDPVGMKGVRLEVDVHIVDGFDPHLQKHQRCVQEQGIQVAEMVYAPLAASLTALDRHQKEFGVVHLDFGGATASLSVFHEGELIHTAVLPIGSRHITNDLAVLLRTSPDNAERVKLELGTTGEADDRRRRDQLDLSQYVGEDLQVPRRTFVGAIDARMDELMEKVRDELKKSGMSGQLPSGVVVSGGGSLLPGFALRVRDEARLAVRAVRPMNVDAAVDAVLDPAYTVALGLVVWGFGREEDRIGRQGPKMAAPEWMKKSFSWLKNFAP
ncbi:MAG TPA: cell division protein FtsA [Candidatus Paceibacterota bacterium]|nr:cell division protein FtsA [Candidatus Paceibacterota bacterium]